MVKPKNVKKVGAAIHAAAKPSRNVLLGAEHDLASLAVSGGAKGVFSRGVRAWLTRRT